MTEYLINEDTLTDIADAIRGKTGSSDPIMANEMATYISNISSGINPEDIPEEVYIGTEEPTDESVKIWIDPNDNSGSGGTSGGVREVYKLDFSNASTSEKACDDEMIAFINAYFETDGNVAVYVRTANSSMIYPATTYVAPYGDNGGYNIYIEPYSLIQHELSNGSERNYYVYCLANRTSGWKYYYNSTGKANIATKEYVDNAISSGGAGAKTYTFTATDSGRWSEEDEAELIYLINYVNNNNKLPENRVYYIKHHFIANTFYQLTTIEKNRNMSTPQWILSGYAEGYNENYIKCYGCIVTFTNSNLTEISSIMNYSKDNQTIKDWQWVDVDMDTFYAGDYDKIMVVVENDGYRYSQIIATGTGFNSEWNNYIISKSDNLYLSCSGGDFNLSTGTVIGYYYWG